MEIGQWNNGTISILLYFLCVDSQKKMPRPRHNMKSIRIFILGPDLNSLKKDLRVRSKSCCDEKVNPLAQMDGLSQCVQ